MKTIREHFIELGILKLSQNSYSEEVKPKFEVGSPFKRSNSSKNIPSLQTTTQTSRKPKPIQQNPINKKRRLSGAICIRCGERIPYGDMLKHKEKIHGERMYVPSPIKRSKSSSFWVHIVQGGLPSLGKRSR
jgi:hypothetical protein